MMKKYIYILLVLASSIRVHANTDIDAENNLGTSISNTISNVVQANNDINAENNPWSLISNTISLEIETNDIVVNCEQKIKEAIQNCDIVLFMKIVSAFKRGLISKNVFDNKKLLHMIDKKFNNLDDTKDWPWTFKEYVGMLLGLTGAAACFTLGGFLIYYNTNPNRPRYYHNGYDSVECGAGALVCGIASFGTSSFIFSNSKVTQKLEKIKFIRKLMKKFSTVIKVKNDEKFS